MLSEDDIRSCLRVRKLFCTLRILPLEVNVEQRTCEVQKTGWKLLLCYLSYCHLLFRTLFAHLRVFHAAFSGLYGKNEPHLLTWDVVLILSSTMYCAWYAIFFIRKPANTIFMLNQAFAASQDSPAGNKRSGTQKRGLVSYLGRHTRQELIVLLLPYSFLFALFMCIAAYVYEPRFKTIPISLMDDRRPLTMALWILEEVWFVATLMAMCIHGATAHALCFEKFLGIIKSIRDCATNSR